jgi:hypothetical protein
MGENHRAGRARQPTWQRAGIVRWDEKKSRTSLLFRASAYRRRSPADGSDSHMSARGERRGIRFWRVAFGPASPSSCAAPSCRYPRSASLRESLSGGSNSEPPDSQANPATRRPKEALSPPAFPPIGRAARRAICEAPCEPLR